MVHRIARVLEVFGTDERVVSVSEVARRADLHVATASRLIEQLVSVGWLQRDEDRKVRVGVRLWEVASRASPTLPLREAAMPFMEDLHAVVRHHTQLGVLEGEEVLFLERLSARDAVINLTRIAGRLPLHASSSGQVLLAHAPAELQERVLRGQRRSYTRHTMTDAKVLRARLADIRKEGYTICPGYIDERATGIAVPVRHGGDVIAALGVVVPNDSSARTVIPALRAAALGISRAVSH
ncbi:IclR family transcriptional regulator [Amycolatopsis sp. K13G38]|uniref:IclR family transcriptional regulator n=2 Tax=Amycolatopsis acididurans TaxID=2724524 RepID=A0ABX1J311_9PSEU|nr:IclR family transcriptional regulator [Amycolatopsis acididurans]NKQ52750.1 IclR family transcriptional regulator [Amycolatopsis acididurans]